MELHLHLPLRIQYFIMSYTSCCKLLVFMLKTGYVEEGNARELYAGRDWLEASSHSLPFSVLFKQKSQRFL